MRENPKFITDENGKKKAVVLSIPQYRRLMEDLHDLAVIAERHEEQAVTLEEMKKRLSDHAAI